MVAGVFTLVAAPYVSRLIRLFPPVVTGTVVLVIGISLMRVGVNWAAGGNPTIATPTGPAPNPAYGLPVNLGIATLVLATVLCMIAFFKGFLCNIAVLIGIATGKRAPDKRETAKKRDWQRQKARILKEN